MTTMTLEAEAEMNSIDLLKVLPNRLIKRGDDLYKRGARFEYVKDKEENKTWCGLIKVKIPGTEEEKVVETWERIRHEGKKEDHLYFLRGATKQAIQSMGFGGARLFGGVNDDEYYHIIDGKLIRYKCIGEDVEYDSVEPWPPPNQSQPISS